MAMIFLDTNVFLYAAGANHPLRKASQETLERVARGQIAATTSTEVVQELLYVLVRRGMRDAAVTLARSTMRLLPDLLPVTRADMLAACLLLEEYPDLPPRDAVHAATMLNHRIDTVLSADEHFDRIRGVRRLAIGSSLSP